MASGGKKKKAADNERISLLENARKQHNYHIGRLEQMLRLLDNNDLSPEQVRCVILLSNHLRCMILLSNQILFVVPMRSRVKLNPNPIPNP